MMGTIRSLCYRFNKARRRLPVKRRDLVFVAAAILLIVRPISFDTNCGETEMVRIFVKDLNATTRGRCAINLFGLPRAFELLVLPSFRKNVIALNAKYNCDYFVHYYHLEQETAGRSGSGGAIHPEEVLLLREQVLQEHALSAPPGAPIPTVQFVVDEEAAFWEQYQAFLLKIEHTLDEWGKPLYFPWKEKSYSNPTTTNNIIKMWHSIQSAWELMEQHEGENDFEYTQVAFLRSDVVYMTPIDVYEYGIEHVVIPGFGRHPVSDRVVYGPRAAIQIWAAERFDRLEDHVQHVLEDHRGYGLHSERYVAYALLPAMRRALLSTKMYDTFDPVVVEHPQLCFFRARPDGTVWIQDCDGKESITLSSVRENLSRLGDIRRAVQALLGRSCIKDDIQLHKGKIQTLKCDWS